MLTVTPLVLHCLCLKYNYNKDKIGQEFDLRWDTNESPIIIRQAISHFWFQQQNKTAVRLSLMVSETVKICKYHVDYLLLCLVQVTFSSFKTFTFLLKFVGLSIHAFEVCALLLQLILAVCICSRIQESLWSPGSRICQR